MPFTETTKITLEAAQAVELHTGVVLPPGSYSGLKARAREDALDGRILTPTRFSIRLTAEQLGSMGATGQSNQSSEETDVTEFVGQGQLRIRYACDAGSDRS